MDTNDDSNNCEAEGDNGAESSEQQPLRSENGVSNGGEVHMELLPVARKIRLPPRFEMDEETHNWRRSDSPSPSPSPSSPFRKKLVFTMPGIMRPKQPRENKLRAFVIFMFFVIVLMISLTYVYHQQHLLKMMQLAVGERIRFGENNRVLQLSNAARQDVLTGRLGTSLATDDLPRNCHVDSMESANETACLEWNHLAKMKVVRYLMSDSVKCYQVQWQSLHDGMTLQDCFSLSYANWYGMGEFNPQLWPMNDLEEYIRTNDTAFITGNIAGQDVFGHILDGYWLSSNGVAIMADPGNPLFISLDRGITGHLCFLSKPNAHASMVTLKYTLCTSWDTQSVHRHVMDKIRTRPSMPKDWKMAVEGIVWSVRQRFGASINDSLLFNYTEEVLSLDVDAGGILVVDSDWQMSDGDFSFSPALFTDPKELLSFVTNRGFRVVLSAHPYISTASKNYYSHLDRQQSFWVTDITGQVPNLVRWGRLSSAVLVDFTNREAAAWFQAQLEDLRVKYRVHGFRFRGGETTSLPPYATFSQQLPNRNAFAQMYNRAVSKPGLAFSVGVVSQLQSLPAFVEISPRQSTWIPPYGLRSVIPAALSAGIVGYPFFLSGPVGGETSSSGPIKPDRELYVRWLQLAVFFPVLQISVLPSDYDDEVVSIARKMLQLRKTVVMPVLKTAIVEAETLGIPIIRPLWWIAPNDTDAQAVDTEFLVGNDLLVAPIIAPHDDQRDIYLPPGLWSDRENAPHKGGKWLYDYRSSLAKVAYFIRIQESTGS